MSKTEQQIIAEGISTFVEEVTPEGSKSINEPLKVGDRIRTIRGGQTPGIVTKIDGDTIHFDHATDKYDTVWSGAKGMPKQYSTHRSNVVKEA